MEFHRVIGKIDKDLVEAAQKKLTSCFLDLGKNPKINVTGSGLGGDPLIFSLIYPMQHICTLNMPTAATDGRKYYWNPKFVLSLSKIGLRIVCYHEACHASYMHPMRRGGRNPRLWNIAVDYIVNGSAMEDLKFRGMDPGATFSKELGNYCTLEQYAEHIKDPFKPIQGSDHWVADANNDSERVPLPKPEDDRELTDKEKEQIEKDAKKVRYFFADPNLPDDMKKAEKIYSYLYNLLPKCEKCGKVGRYKLPKQDPKGKKDKEDKQKSKDKSDDSSDGDQKDQQNGEGDKDGQGQGCGHDHGNHSCGSKGDGQGCDECEDTYDIFDFGDTVDDHMDAEESQEKMAKRMADAMEAAKRMAGSVPSFMEDELGALIAPKIKWQDHIRAKLRRVRDGNSRNDWTRFRSRPMAAGILTPKRVTSTAIFGCLLDTSGSMSREDMTFGVSQLQSLDERSEGWLVPADADIYWKDATKLRKVNSEEISRVKVLGRGGTMFSSFFDEYEQHMGKTDFLIMITDGYLMDTDVAAMKDPGIPVYWLITSAGQFNAPFGKVYQLRD